jgi:hypothetical protein
MQFPVLQPIIGRVLGRFTPSLTSVSLLGAAY